MTFQSPQHLQESLSPHTLELVENYLDISSIPLTFQVSPHSVRHRLLGSVLKTSLFQDDLLTVYYPETPRVPHHLAITLNRSHIHGISEVTEEENAALFATIKKITEIYKTISIQGFVIAQYNKPQEGHANRYVVEVIPHLPGFHTIKNIVDKMDCNRYVLYRHANLTPATYTIPQEETQNAIQFWKHAFQEETEPLAFEDVQVSLPFTRYQSHKFEAKDLLKRHLLELLQDKGGKASQELSHAPFFMPLEIPEDPTPIQVSSCFFCDPNILAKQRVFEYQGVEVLYNVRRGAKPGCNFLILPKRHVQKVYSLSLQEIHAIGKVRKALVEALKAFHPEHEVIVYLQDDPSVGQTVFHSHEQVVSIDPHTIALSWTLMSLHYNMVTEEEMLQVRKSFGQKMEEIK